MTDYTNYSKKQLIDKINLLEASLHVNSNYEQNVLSKSVIQNSVEGISIANEQGIIIEWNIQLEIITGILANDVIGKYIWEIQLQMDPVHLRTNERLIQYEKSIKEFLKTGESVLARKALEREYTKPNGQNIVIQGIINPVKTEKGYILVSTSEDITIRKKTQEALEISEKKSKSLMQQSPFVVELYDINGLQIEVNKAYEDLWEFPAETTVNKFNVLLSKEVEDTGLMKYVKRAYAGEAVEVPEYEFNPTGETESKGFGRVRWLNTRIYPIKDNQNNVTNIVIVHQDVTERNEAEQLLKQSEEKFRSIFESNIVGVIFWNAEGEISDANELFLGLMGYTKKELLNKEIRWKDMTPPEYAQYDKEMLIELSEKGFVTPFEKEYFHKDGHRIPIIIGAATLTSMENSGVAFILDISKRKKSEEEIIRYRDHLEEMVRDRTKELEDKNADLERFNELFVNREFRIKELRDKVKELEAGL